VANIYVDAEFISLSSFEDGFDAVCFRKRSNDRRSGDSLLPTFFRRYAVAVHSSFSGHRFVSLVLRHRSVGRRYPPRTCGPEILIVPPFYSLRIPDIPEFVCLLGFLLACFGVIALGEARRRHNEELRKGRLQLEECVRERTSELSAANESLRDLSARLLQTQDEERRRLARKLHDSVGQLLAGLSMNLANLRTISHLLHPPLLDEAGLESALRWYVDGFAQRSRRAWRQGLASITK
jgi:signal transduction histidine kinase